MSVRKSINRYLKKINYEIVKIDRFKNLLNSHYAKHGDFCFIQIGANDGVNFDHLYEFVTSRPCRGVVVEPLKAYFKKLQQNYQYFPDITARNIAVHSVDKTAIIYHVDPQKLDKYSNNAAGIGSFDPAHHNGLNVAKEDVVEESVACLNLMDIVQESGFNKIDLLQIDVESYDAEVVKMIDFNTIKPFIIKYEHESLSSKDQSEVKQLLVENGYQIFHQRTDTIAYYPV